MKLAFQVYLQRTTSVAIQKVLLSQRHCNKRCGVLNAVDMRCLPKIQPKLWVLLIHEDLRYHNDSAFVREKE